VVSLRAALLSLPLVIAGTAGAQSAAPAPAGPAPANPAAPGAGQGAGTPVQAAPAATPPAARASAAGAQQPPGRIGLGAAIGTSGVIQALYVPIDVGAVRAEAEVGYVRASADAADASVTRLGIGIFGLAPTSPSVQAYGGVRLQYVHLESRGTSDALRVAAVLGGEWAAAPAAALGLEGQLGYASSGSASGVDVSAQVFLRIFLASFGRPASASPAPAGGGASASPAPAGGGASANPAAATGGGSAPRKSPGLQKCSTSNDCDRGICYEGYCRH
jgi:hypothetical protein